MGYIRLFIELQDETGREGGGQSRVEILDRSDRTGRRWEIKVRLSLWGLTGGQPYSVNLVCAKDGRYRKHPLGQMQVASRGRGEFTFRDIFEEISPEEMNICYFDAIVVEHNGQSVRGYRRGPVDWRGWQEVREEPAVVQAVSAAKENENIEPEMLPEPEEPPQIPEMPEELPPIPEMPEELPLTEPEVPQETPRPSEIEPQESPRPPEPDHRMENFFRQYRKVYPFYDGRQRWVRIRLEDLRMLPPEQQKLAHNPFLQRAYRRYGYLILGDCAEGGFVLGVPGRYLPAMAPEARQEGFEEFRSIRGLEPGYGEYGYWLYNF